MGLETGTYIADLVVSNPTSSDPISQGDDHIRLEKTAMRNSFAGFTGAILTTGTDGGAVNAYTLTPATTLPSYSSKMLVEFTPNATNTGAATLNISGLGVKPIISQAGVAMAAGDLVSGCTYLCAYDGTSFRLISVTTAYVDAVRAYATTLAFAAAIPVTVADIGKLLGAGDGITPAWEAKTPPEVKRSERTANVILGIADRQKLIDITSGTFSQTFEPAATLTDGWYCWIRNSGTGDITLDPSGAELIDGLASFVMYPGEARLVQCTGTAFTSVVISAFTRTGTSSITFVKPPGYGGFNLFLLPGGGGGGSGGRAQTGQERSGGSAGGAGAPAQYFFPSSMLSANETLTVGAGGAGGAAQTANNTAGVAGTVGGNTTFGTKLMAKGGNFGLGGTVSGASVAGGAALNGFPISTSFTATAGGAGNTTTGSNGTSSGAGACAPTGGGGGGGAAAASTVSAAGGNGGAMVPASTAGSGRFESIAGGVGSTTGGSAATAGVAGVGNLPGTGGGGGRYATGVVGTDGAAGGANGGGGGGGGASDNGFASGAGAAGGAGYFMISGIL